MPAPVRSKTKGHSEEFKVKRALYEETMPVTKKVKKAVIIPKYPKFDPRGDLNLLKHDLRHVREKYLGYPKPSEDEKKKREFLESRSR